MLGAQSRTIVCDRRFSSRQLHGPRTPRPVSFYRLLTDSTYYLSTTMSELPDRFDFAATEREIYNAWLSAGCFNGHRNHSSRVGGHREPYTIVMPPPNVTAILHVGHGLN